MAEDYRRDAPSPAPASVPASGEGRVGALGRRDLAQAKYNCILALLEALSLDHPWTQRDAVKRWPDRAVA